MSESGWQNPKPLAVRLAEIWRAAGRRFPVHGTAGHQHLHLRANGSAPLVSKGTIGA